MSTAGTIARSSTFVVGVLLLTGFTPVSNSAPTVHTIEIKGMQFQPAELKVRRGDTVVWINRDLVIHDVTEETTKAWTSSPIPTGRSWRRVVTKNENYYCSIHQVMKGKLRVE